MTAAANVPAPDQRTLDQGALDAIALRLGDCVAWDSPAEILEAIASYVERSGRPHPGEALRGETYPGRFHATTGRYLLDPLTDDEIAGLLGQLAADDQGDVMRLAGIPQLLGMIRAAERRQGRPPAPLRTLSEQAKTFQIRIGNPFALS